MLLIINPQGFYSQLDDVVTNDKGLNVVVSATATSAGSRGYTRTDWASDSAGELVLDGGVDALSRSWLRRYVVLIEA